MMLGEQAWTVKGPLGRLPLTGGSIPDHGVISVAHAMVRQSPRSDGPETGSTPLFPTICSKVEPSRLLHAVTALATGACRRIARERSDRERPVGAAGPGRATRSRSRQAHRPNRLRSPRSVAGPVSYTHLRA